MKSTNDILKLISSSIGIVGGVTGLISYKGDYGIVGISVLLIIISIALISSVYGIIKRKNITIIGPIDLRRYSIRSAKKYDLIEITNLQKSCYPDDAVPHHIYTNWFETNPDGFFVVELITTNSGGVETKEIVGHFTFLAIKESCMEIYRQGDMLETGIAKSHLYTPSEKSKMDSIYVESVIIRKQHRREVIARLLRMLDSMVAYFCGITPEVGLAGSIKHTYAVKKVYAMAATDDGIKTLKGMGFDAITLANNKERLDKHEMYECDFDKFLSLVRLREEMYEMKLLK